MNKPKFYVTTPIYYVNDVPHLGHAYTTIAADVLARYRRLEGYDVFFLTGTDEHGQKVEQAAGMRGETPLALADRMAGRFKGLWRKLNISNDDFIRTTERRHIRASQALFQTLYEKGDIYKGEYEDWYCTPCETYWTQTQFERGKNCPSCGRPTQKLKEESYFFRLSKYQQPLLDYIEAHPDFILPLSRRNEVLSFIQGGLKDLSVTRTSFNWGVSVPVDDKHIIYVWLDALTNYLTAAGYPDDMERFNRLWPADVHLLAKDILRFHAVYWPAFLMSAGLPPPRRVVVHGWWTVEGQKMSKSLGNVVDPEHLIPVFGVDVLRYFILREVPFGNDGDFSDHALRLRNNSDLANDLGNLLQRSLAMVSKYYQGIVPRPGPEQAADIALAEGAHKLVAGVDALLDKLAFSKLLRNIWEYIAQVNRYIGDQAPWELHKTGQQERLGRVLYTLLEALRIIALLIYPYMPSTAERMWRQLGIEEDLEDQQLSQATAWGGIRVGSRINQQEALFRKIE
jgi:methionyl-tRNA synthetase